MLTKLKDHNNSCASILNSKDQFRQNQTTTGDSTKKTVEKVNTQMLMLQEPSYSVNSHQELNEYLNDKTGLPVPLSVAIVKNQGSKQSASNLAKYRSNP